MTSPFELPGFEPVRRIGGGGFGDVWLSKQTSIDREVAIKVGHAPLQDDTVKIRFDRECKALGLLSGHPNIVGVFTAGTLDDGRPYLVLEYVDGGTLWQRLKRAPLTDGELINIGRELSAALDAAHSSGILHRDLKPENILVRSTGGAVLGDFGIARLQDGANTTSASITASVAYAAPEVLSGKQATASTDLYGIGVCLLAAAIRAVPFVEKSDESIQPILKRVLSDRHPDLTEHGVSAELAELLDGLLQKNPSKRPQKAADVLAQFSALHARISGTVPILPYEFAAPRSAPPPPSPDQSVLQSGDAATGTPETDESQTAIEETDLVGDASPVDERRGEAAETPDDQVVAGESQVPALKLDPEAAGAGQGASADGETAAVDDTPTADKTESDDATQPDDATNPDDAVVADNGSAEDDAAANDDGDAKDDASAEDDAATNDDGDAKGDGSTEVDAETLAPDEDEDDGEDDLDADLVELDNLIDDELDDLIDGDRRPALVSAAADGPALDHAAAVRATDGETVARALPEIDEAPSDPSADIRLFLIAYTATVVLGGLLLLLFL